MLHNSMHNKWQSLVLHAVGTLHAGPVTCLCSPHAVSDTAHAVSDTMSLLRELPVFWLCQLVCISMLMACMFAL